MKKSEMTRDEKNELIIKIIIRFSFFPIFIGLLTLLPAGTFNYWQVYVYFATLIIPMIFVILYFLKNDPKFLGRRMKMKEKEKVQMNIQTIFSLFLLYGMERMIISLVVLGYWIFYAFVVFLKLAKAGQNLADVGGERNIKSPKSRKTKIINL